MGKNKAKLYFPEQKTKHIHLHATQLICTKDTPIPEEMIQVSQLIAKKKIKKAFLLMKTCFEKNPYNLFIRIRYADFLLMQKNKQKALALFNNKRDLVKAFPTTSAFFLEEYVSFLSFLGHLSLSEYNREAAEEYHYLLYKLAPEDARTKFLARKIRKRYTFFYRIKLFFVLRLSKCM